MWLIHFSWSLNHSHDLHAFNRKYVSFKPDALIDCLAIEFVKFCINMHELGQFIINLL